LYSKPHINEFSKNSQNYYDYSIIQKKVAKKVVNSIKNFPNTILDLGCGSGYIYNSIDWEVDKFVGYDLSSKMLNLHSKGKNVYLRCKDFDTIDANEFKLYDLIVSSSSLQWSSDIKKILVNIDNYASSYTLAIFCSGTFKSINSFINIDSFLPSRRYLEEFYRYRDVSIETVEYRLDFEDNQSIFKYLKKSGVSGGKQLLKYRDIKKLIRDYDRDYLEFEVMFISKS
jgi:malonyl-CoA O-methyltransferase